MHRSYLLVAFAGFFAVVVFVLTLTGSGHVDTSSFTGSTTFSSALFANDVATTANPISINTPGRHVRKLASFDPILSLSAVDYKTVIEKINHPKVVVQQHLRTITGAPEALIQLALAFHSWIPDNTYMVSDEGSLESIYTSKWLENYPALAEVQKMHGLDGLVAGDIHIIPEVQECPDDLISRGVHVYIWMLGARDKQAIEDFKRKGCKFLSHNFWLSHNIGVDIGQQFVLRPYISPNKIPKYLPNNDRRENLILVNGDDVVMANVNDDTIRPVMAHCENTGDCEVIFLKGFTREELMDLYQRAKVIIAMCMRGCERAPIEAALSGVALVTNNCQTGSDKRDMPIPEHLLVNTNNTSGQPVELFTTPGAVKWDQPSSITVSKWIMENFETAQAEFNELRKLYLLIGPESLAHETKVFMETHHTKLAVVS